MADPVRFYLDEHVPAAVADAPRLRGIDVARAQDVGLRRASDRQHLEFALSEGHVIVTRDSDFLRFHSRGDEHPGMAYYQPGSRSTSEVIASLILIYQVLDADDMRGRVEFL